MRKILFTLALLISFSFFGQTAEEYLVAGEDKSIELDFSGAILDFSKAIELNPNYFKAWNSRAIVKMRLEDYYGAISDFTKATELDPNHLGCKRGRATCKYRLGDDKGTITDFDEIIKLSQSNNEPIAFDYFYRGRAKSGLYNSNGAIVDYSKAIELDPNDYFVYFLRGCEKNLLDDYYAAIADFTKAIEIDPNYAVAYSQRGSAKAALGDVNGACADIKKAANLGDLEASKLAKNCN